MEKKSTKKAVSDDVKAEAAKKAAKAKKLADAKKSGSAQTREVEEADVAERENDAPEKAKKQRVVKKISEAEKKQVKGLRIAAIILWVLAIGAEVGAFFALRTVALNASPTQTWADPECLLLIGMLVLDAVLCIVAAQLWKKSNAISPCLSDSAFVRTVYHQLGVIMTLVCFVPIGILLLLKSKNMNKKLKTILLAAFVALFVGATATSVDYKQPSAEEVEQLKQDAVVANGDIYWTRYGKSYHFDRACNALARTSKANLFSGSIDDAINAHRYDPCDFCAEGDAVDALDDSADTVDDTEALPDAA